MFKEFLKFLQRGNVIDLAVAVIIGGAFNGIVTSLVNDIIMPLVGIVLGRVDFKSLKYAVGGAEVTYGNFIQAIVNFLIIAFVLFLVVRAYNNMRRKEEVKPPAKEELPRDTVLLTEIRDLLRSSAASGPTDRPVAK